MKRPSEGAISESDLRQRIVQLEQIVEQQTARIVELEQEFARRKGRSRRDARAASSESGASSSSRTDASRRRSSGRSPGGQPGHEDTAVRGYRWSRWTNRSPSSRVRATDADTG